MPEDKNVIFKLSLDDQGFIIPLERDIAGYDKFVEAQRRANQSLLDSRAALDANKQKIADLSAELERLAQIRATTGKGNILVENNLKTALAAAQSETAKLSDAVDKNKISYDQATLSAKEFLDVASKAAGLGNIPAPGSTLQPAQLDLFNPPTVAPTIPGQQLDLTFPTQLPEDISNTTAEMEKLAAAMQLVKQRMDELDPNSAEWQELNGILQAGTAVVTEYGKQIKDTGSIVNESVTKHVNLRTQITNLRNEMARLAEAGKINTAEFRAVAAEAGHLTKVYREQQERIRFLSSENRTLDFGKAAIRGAIGAFETFTSVSVLFGEKNEELEKQTLKLFAAMQLLNGIEELTQLARKSSTVVLGLETAATSVYTTVVGAATGATKAFRIALLATGIGAVVAGLAFLVAKFIEIKNAQEDANEEAKVANEINEKAIDGYASQVANLEILKRQLTDLNTPQAERVALAKEYNKTADEGNKIDTTQINNTKALTSAIDAQSEAIKRRALAEAGRQVTQEKAKALFEAQQKLAEEAPDFQTNVDNLDLLDKQIVNVTDAMLAAAKTSDIATTEHLQNVLEDLRKIRAAAKEFQSAVGQAAIAATATAPPLLDETTVEGRKKVIQAKIDEIELAIGKLKSTDTKTIQELRRQQALLKKELESFNAPKGTTPKENVFEQEAAKLRDQLAELRAKETLDIQVINEKFAKDLEKEKLRIEKLVATPAQKKILINLAIEVNEEQRDKAVADAQKQIQDTITKIEEQLQGAQLQAQIDIASNIEEQFTRRAQLIELNERKELSSNQKNLDEQLTQLKTSLDQRAITQQQYEDFRNRLTSTAEQEATAITLRFARERQTLSIDIFKQTLDSYRQAITDANLQIDSDTATFIRNASDRFLSGQISFKQFQKQTEEFRQQQDNKSRENVIKNNNAEIFATDHKLSTIRDHTTKEYQDLLKRRQQLSDETKKLETADATADAEAKQKIAQERIDTIQGYATAIGSIATSVIGFWQAANEAESAALDRSIALQQRRVDEALRIADKGNAQYLKAEADRLKELEVQRENAARRQLGVNAALQASQILVAITGAIAKIAAPGVGVAQVFTEIAVIVGALATGYGLIKQLQANQPRFKEGTPYVSRGTNKPGTDTVPAWLTEGEAVIPVDKNRKYKSAVDAIYHERIPADVLNNFVSQYAAKRSEKTIVEKVLKGEKVTQEFINNVSKTNFDEKSVLIYTLQNLVKRQIGEKHDSAFLSTVKSDEIKTYSEIVNRVMNVKQTKDVNQVVFSVLNPPENEKIYKKFVSGIEKLSEKKITEFIASYEKETMIKLVKDQARVKEEKQIKSVVDHNGFINTFHQIKHVPVPNYEYIAETNEMKLGQDGKMRAAIEEQNSLLRENNEHQKETQAILKAMDFSIKFDEEGVSAMVMKYIKQKEIYSKL